MSGYTEILYLMGAIVIFSLLSLQVNRMILRNNLIQVESSVEYHVVTHAQDYADQIQLIQSEDDLDDFLDDFPRVDSISYDENNPSAVLVYSVDIEAADTTLPNSNVSSKMIHIYLNNQFLSAGKPSQPFRLELMKSFDS